MGLNCGRYSSTFIARVIDILKFPMVILSGIACLWKVWKIHMHVIFALVGVLPTFHGYCLSENK